MLRITKSKIIQLVNAKAEIVTLSLNLKSMSSYDAAVPFKLNFFST